MILAIAFVLASVVGMVYGINKKNKFLLMVSVIILFMIISVWIYFYNNPY